eukprot:jgi/Chlat1/4794/Chrsp31S04825
MASSSSPAALAALTPVPCMRGLRRDGGQQKSQATARATARSLHGSRRRGMPPVVVGAQDDGAAASSRNVLSVLCPLLRLIGGGDPAAPRNRTLEVATSGVASLARLPYGSVVLDNTRHDKARPKLPLQLYEFEACPFCRRVRETLTALDLNAEIYPCPKDSLRHRARVQALGGQQQYVRDIVKYLYEQYGGAAAATPPSGFLTSTYVTGFVPTLVRGGRGMSRYSRAATEPPAQLLRLYSYENNQFARLVREALCELELPYLLVSTGKGSAQRSDLAKIAGSTQVPYLVDLNTGVQMGESADIINYLFKTYSAAVPAESAARL